jgi:hypothetical protein
MYLTGEAGRQAVIHQEARLVRRDGLDDIQEYFFHGLGKDMDRVHTRQVVRDIWPGQDFRQFRFDDVTQFLMNQGWQKRRSVRIDEKITAGFVRQFEKEEANEID